MDAPIDTLKLCFGRIHTRILMIALLLIASITCFANPTDTTRFSARYADSLLIHQNKLKSKSTVETIVSFPGYVAFLPLKIVFEVQKFIIAQAFEGNFLAEVLDVLTTDDDTRGILPTYSSSSGGGLKFFQKGLFTPNSKLSLSATMGLRERKQFQLKLKKIEFSKRINSQFLVKYHFQSDESFYGIGQDTRVDDRTNFANELGNAEFNVGIQFSEKNRVGIMAGYDRNKISKGRNSRYPSTTEVASFSSLPGIERVIQIAKLQLEIRHDSNFHPGNPTAGFDVLMRGGIGQEINKDEYGFYKLTIDVSHYFPLFYNRTFKLRFAGEFTEDIKGRLIPFYYLSELGRSETIRGFARGRFRDKDMVLGSVEYSYPIWTIINAQLFLDAGTVSHNVFKYFDISDLKYGYGVAFQLWNEEGVMSDFTIAHSEEGFRFYLGINKSL